MEAVATYLGITSRKYSICLLLSVNSVASPLRSHIRRSESAPKTTVYDGSVSIIEGGSYGTRTVFAAVTVQTHGSGIRSYPSGGMDVPNVQ